MGESVTEGIYPTMLSAFIADLQTLLDERGDIPVVAYGQDARTTRINAGILEFYYDGGWLDPTEPGPFHCRHWRRSRTRGGSLSNPARRTGFSNAVLIRADEPETYLSEEYCRVNDCMDVYEPPNVRDTIDGVPAPDMPDSEA